MSLSDTKIIPDFTSDPDIVRVVAEDERLSYGHLFNPTFATEISKINPLPHQRIAVYDDMLQQPRLRFLLADNAGAGKTIMAGLYIREMLCRRLILIIPPAGLFGNWKREMNDLFSLSFQVIGGSDIQKGNPFTRQNSDLLIISIDMLTGSRMFSKLRDSEVLPYDLIVFDEAHKLSANRGADFREKRQIAIAWPRRNAALSLSHIRHADIQTDPGQNQRASAL